MGENPDAPMDLRGSGHLQIGASDHISMSAREVTTVSIDFAMDDDVSAASFSVGLRGEHLALDSVSFLGTRPFVSTFAEHPAVPFTANVQALASGLNDESGKLGTLSLLLRARAPLAGDSLDITARAYRRDGSPAATLHRSISVGKIVPIPTSVALMQNYPNPFNPATVIGYQLPSRTRVRLIVYDILGRRVATLVDADQDAGAHTIRWDATGLATGTYLYRLEAGESRETRKMILMK